MGFVKNLLLVAPAGCMRGGMQVLPRPQASMAILRSVRRPEPRPCLGTAAAKPATSTLLKRVSAEPDLEEPWGQRREGPALFGHHRPSYASATHYSSLVARGLTEGYLCPGTVPRLYAPRAGRPGTSWST